MELTSKKAVLYTSASGLSVGGTATLNDSVLNYKFIIAVFGVSGATNDCFNIIIPIMDNTLTRGANGSVVAINSAGIYINTAVVSFENETKLIFGVEYHNLWEAPKLLRVYGIL